MPIYSLDGIAPELPADGDYFVAETAVLIGRVRLLPGASVWFGAVLRGDNTPLILGEETNFQDGAVGHSDADAPLTIGARVTVGHEAILHGCTVGDDCLIGMGSVVLDNAVVEDWAFVAAAALVAPNKRVPTGQMMMGNPGRITRALTEADRAWITHSWNAYVKRSREYMAEQ